MTSMLLDLAIKTTVVAIGTFVVITAMRRASAAARHLTWTAMFCVIVLLPVAGLTLPMIPVPVLASSGPEPVFQRSGELTFAEPAPARLDDRAADVPVVPSADAPIFAQTTPASGGAWTAEQMLAAVWIAGAAIVFFRILVGVLLARRRDRRAHPVTDRDLIDRLDQVRRATRLRRSVRLLISPAERMPVTWGLIRPTILLPSSALAWMRECPERLDAVLAHETAHVARWDVLSQFLARLGVTMFWFNPLIWIAARRARLERERACDDAVLALGSKPSDYAGQLMAVVQSLAAPAVGADRTLAMARSSQIERRVRAILDARVNRRGVSRSGLVTVAVLVAAVLPVSSIRLTARAVPAEASAPVGLDIPASTVSPALPSAAQPATHVRAGAPGVPPLVASTPVSSSPVLTSSEINQAQQPPPGQVTASQAVAAWRGEREALLEQLLKRAQRHWSDALKKVEIGTMAPIDTVTLETTIAKIEQALLVEKTRVFVDAPSEAELADVRRRVTQALRNLDEAEIRFDNGLLTAKELSSFVLAAADAIRLPATDAMFNAANFPGATSTDLNNASALYALLTSDDQYLRTFHLAHADVQEVAQIVNQMLTTTGTGSRPTVTMDRSLNALVVRATPATLQVIQGIIDAVDRPASQRAATNPQPANAQQAGQDLYVQTFYLSHADVQEVVQILNQMLTTAPTGSRPTITQSRSMNAVIVRATAPTLDLIRNIIETVDKPAKTADAPMTDAALIAALKSAAAIDSDTERANTLIALAQRQAFTPEMVSLYVAAARGIPSEAERARVFAQAIRVKSPER